MCCLQAHMTSSLEDTYSQLCPTIGQRGASRSGPNWPSRWVGKETAAALAIAQMVTTPWLADYSSWLTSHVVGSE